MLILIAAATAAAALLPPRPLRDFGDWTVGCDNGGVCQAVALRPEDVGGDEGPPFWTLSAKRAASGARPEIEVEAVFEEVALASHLLVDGKATPFGFDDSGALVAGDPRLLLRTVAQARQVAFRDAAGKIVGRLSAKGATAALLWMSERQGSAGRAPPPLPRIAPPPPSARPPHMLSARDIATIRKRYGCGRVASEAVQAYRLDAGNSLAIVPCMLHAYQSSSIVVVVPSAGRWRPALLEKKFASENPDDTPEWMTEPEYHPADRSLWTYYKGRGLGDCGGAEGYVWEGRQFRLAFLNAMNRCGGSRARITLWRTANQPDP
jgi:hypothetical protein